MKKIKVGLLIDSFDIPFWTFRMIEFINSSDYAVIALVVKKKLASDPKDSLYKRLKKNFNIILYLLYRRLENIISKPIPDAFVVKDLRQLIKASETLEVNCIEKKYSDYIIDTDIVKINQYNIDVLIRIGFRILRGNILNAAKMGIWSYHHGDNFVNRGGPAGFWEVFQKEREIGCILQILTEDLDGGEVLYRSWSSVNYSLNESLNQYYWRSSLFLPRKLKELYQLGEINFLNKLKSENERLYIYSNKLYTIPKNHKFLKLLLANSLDRVKHHLWKFFNFEQWILLYSFNKNNQLSTSIFRYKRLRPPKDRFWADPCVVYKDEKYYIFFEEFIYNGKDKKGHLSVIEVDKKRNFSTPKLILKRPYHLSYPYVFEYKGEYYLIPESAENLTIELHHATNFPYEWEFQMNLMENIKAVDTTIFIRDEIFWLFTNLGEVSGTSCSEELFLFSSDNLFTKNWQYHPCNPIVSDVKSARSAGRIFYHKEKLYRPSQDCSYRYGHSTVINEIVVLTEKYYKEQKVSSITPEWDDDIVATHTLSFDQELSVIDALIKRRK